MIARRSAGPAGRTIYLDHAATAPLRPEVAQAMAPFMATRFGNSSGSHHVARDARRALEDARERVANVVGASPGEIVFTSGGSESDSLAIVGALAARLETGLATRGRVLCDRACSGALVV